MRCAVIITTCDRPSEILSRAVDSALKQGDGTIVSLVDDGLAPAQNKWDGRIILSRTAGRIGLPAARNVGLASLPKDVDAVCYLDDDDELLPNHVKLLSERLRNGAPFAFSRAMYKHRDGSTTEDPEPSNHDPHKAYYDGNALLRQNIAPVSSFMHWRSTADVVGGWDESVLRMEDWDFWGRMFLAYGPPSKVDAVTNVIYRTSPVNMTDCNQYAYSMACLWRDIVEARLKFLAANGRCRLTDEDRRYLHVPRVSVLMPFRDASSFMEEAMSSVMSQDFQDFEIVAVNDGSRDDSERIVASLGGQKVKIVDGGGNGVTRALNRGLLFCRCEYVARMDADDACLPERFGRQVAFLDEHRDVGVLGTRFLSMDAGLKNVVWDNHDVPTSPDEVKAAMPSRCCVGHPTVMMRRRVVEIVGGYDESPEFKAVEDYELWLRALSRGVKIANLPDTLLKHRTHPAQVGRVLVDVQRANTERLKKRYAVSVS
jgi:glycosyltransferase involved in cell wall biosynthesis